MKKIILSIIAMTAFVCSSNAQTSGAAIVPDPKAILSKVEKTKKSTLHPKKSLKAPTWINYAVALNDAYNINILNVYIGAEEEKIITLMGAPTNASSIPVKDIGDKQFKVYEYPNIDIYFSMDNKVSFFIEKNPLYPNALEEQELALLKAISLSDKVLEKTKPMLEHIINNYLILFQNNFTNRDYAAAIPYAEKAAKLQKNPSVNVPFTESYYYAVLSAMQGKDYASVKKFVNILLENDDNRDGEILYYLAIAEEQLGNVAEAKKTLEKGVSLYPKNQDLIKTLIDVYTRTKEDPAKVIPYIKQAQIQDPANAILFIVEGVAYENIGQLDKSITAYENAIKIDPKSFAAYYNLGYTYSTIADDLVPEFNNIDYRNKTLYNKKLKEINDLRTKAIAPLLKAYEIDPVEENAITLLKSLYFGLRDTSPEMQTNFDKFNALYLKFKK